MDLLSGRNAGNTKRAEIQNVKERQKSITDSEVQNHSPLDFVEPPYSDPYERWWERSGGSHPLLLDSSCFNVSRSAINFVIISSMKIKNTVRVFSYGSFFSF